MVDLFELERLIRVIVFFVGIFRLMLRNVGTLRFG